jgi:hypothetical protein
MSADEGNVSSASPAPEILYDSERTRVVRVHPGGGEPPVIQKQPLGPGAAERLRNELADMPPTELGRLIQTLEEEMHEASADLRFEYAARLRDEVKELKRELRDAGV